jgi:hypothetical protein
MVSWDPPGWFFHSFKNRKERANPLDYAQSGCGLNLLERLLVAASHTAVIIPFNDRVIFVRLLNCAEFSSRLSEGAQTLDAISGTHFRAGCSGLGECWPLGSV